MPKSKPNTFLTQYAKLFNSIEMNSTFYSTPRDSVQENWRKQTPKDFRFCAKIAQHISRTHAIDTKIDAMLRQIEHLKILDSRMDTFFMQLPQTFSPQYANALYAFLDAVPEEINLAVEFRHPEWFEPTVWSETCLNLQSLKIGTVITDVAGRRDVLHMSYTTPFVVVRFVGNGLLKSDFQRFDDWVERLETWRKNGLQTVYFLHHQPGNELAPDACVHFYKKMKEKYYFDCRCVDEMPKFGIQPTLF
jgi:Uncharacterized conserved protein